MKEINCTKRLIALCNMSDGTHEAVKTEQYGGCDTVTEQLYDHQNSTQLGVVYVLRNHRGE